MRKHTHRTHTHNTHTHAQDGQTTDISAGNENEQHTSQTYAHQYYVTYLSHELANSDGSLQFHACELTHFLVIPSHEQIKQSGGLRACTYIAESAQPKHFVGQLTGIGGVEEEELRR